MHDVTKMPIIGKVTTKPLTYNVTFGDKTQAYEMPAETYSVVHIFEDDGQKTYVTNIWHKEYKRVPLLIIEKLVDKYEPVEIKAADGINIDRYKEIEDKVKSNYSHWSGVNKFKIPEGLLERYDNFILNLKKAGESVTVRFDATPREIVIQVEVGEILDTPLLDSIFKNLTFERKYLSIVHYSQRGYRLKEEINGGYTERNKKFAGKNIKSIPVTKLIYADGGLIIGGVGNNNVLKYLGFNNPKDITPIILNGKTVGGIDVTTYRGDTEILRVHMMLILPEFQGKGIGAKAINKLFRENPNVKQIIGNATAESKSFWQKIGAEFHSNEHTAFTITRFDDGLAANGKLIPTKWYVTEGSGPGAKVIKGPMSKSQAQTFCDTENNKFIKSQEEIRKTQGIDVPLRKEKYQLYKVISDKDLGDVGNDGFFEEGGYLHGSSHEFCDTGFKLDTEKEGQGESLFGRGLYFTKDQKLAEYYAKFVKPEGVNDAIRQKVADKLGFKTYDEIPYDFENKKIKTKYGEHLKFDLFHQYLKQYVDKSKEKGNIYKVTLFPGKDNSEYRILDFSGENHQLQENIERDKKDLKNIIDTLVKNKRKYSTWIKSYFDDKGLEFDPEKYNSDFKSTLRDMKDYYDNFYTYSTSTPLLKNLAYDLKKIFKPEFFRFTKNPLELTNDPNHYMSLQENRVKFNEDSKIYQGKRLTDFFQEAGYNAITYSFSPSIIPLEDNGEYDANAIVIFNDKDVKIDECEKAEDGKNIYYKPKLIKKSVLNDFQSGSSLDFYDNKIFVVGDDTKDLLIINTDFEELNRVRLFESPDRRIAKDLKADLETSTIINHNGTPSILMLGSGARDNKSFGYIVPFDTLKVTEPFKYDVFINRLKNEHGIEKVNIEGSASMDDDFILSNRGNKNNPDNFLIITENNFWENQSTVKISLSRLLLPNKDAGVSEIYYETDSDTLFFTASVEQTTNNYDDGEIGDSFIGYISSFSNKLSENTITPDLFLNLTEIDSSFDKQKIEGICIENKSDEYYTINLVSDNDNDESTIFKIELKKQNIAANGKKIPERYKNIGFTSVGQKKKSTRPEKKWMVLARKGDKYKVVHGGYKGMQDYSQHHDDVRRKRFWNRMGGFDSEKANDPFSPLYWHKKFGTWEDGGPIYGNGVLNEEAQMYIDIISSNPNDERYQKYKNILKEKHGIDFNDIYKDQYYIDNASLNDIKRKEDFLSFDKYIEYAKKIFKIRGLVNILPKNIEGTITIEQAKEIGYKLNFKVEHRDYDGGKGNYAAHDLIDTISIPSVIDVNIFIHEIGHHYDYFESKGYNGLANTITYASSHYEIGKSDEVFAENFKHYFIAPKWLKDNLPMVYDELDRVIKPLYKYEINKLITDTDIRYDNGGGIISNEGLSYLLGKKSEVEQIGIEKKSPFKSSFNGLTIELYISEYGSYRFVAVKNEEIVSAIQVMSRDGKFGYVSNAYTEKEYRNKGIGAELIKFIRKYFTEITFSEDRSMLGERFVNSLADFR